jgi:hypothetical protein
MTNHEGNPIKLPVRCEYGGVGYVPLWQDADGIYVPFENIVAFINAGQNLPLRTILHRWSKASHIQLCTGEMTAGELRSVKAVVAAITRECFPEDLHTR